DAVGEAVGESVEHVPPLSLAGGSPRARGFSQKQLGETERKARRNMRVAKFASPNEEAHYGTSKLDAALSFLETKAGELKGRLPVDFAKLRVPVERDKGSERSVSLEDASVQEILAATRKLQRAGKPASSPAVVAITRAFGTKALRGISVRLAGGKISLGAIPLDALKDLASALAKVQLPNT